MDKKWIMEKGILLAFRALKGTKEFNDALYALTARADAVGRLEGMKEGFACAQVGESLESHPNYQRIDNIEESWFNAYHTLSEREPDLLDDIFETACDRDFAGLTYKKLLERGTQVMTTRRKWSFLVVKMAPDD
jgi:hypothetical protein